MLYLDYCATTPPLDEVVDTIADVMKKHYGNPSSLHRFGLDAERLLGQARAVIAATLSAKPDEIILTSGGTESNQLAIRGVAGQFASRGNHLITSAVEHPSVLECFRALESEGFRVTVLPVDATGRVSVDELREAITSETILVSLMHVNNETGRIQPVEEAGELLRAYPRIVFHVDAVQSAGKLPLDPAAHGIDLLSVSAHKLRGPKGAGFLYRRRGLALKPLFVGGGQEFGLRSGTPNVPLAVGMAKAVRIAFERSEQAAAHLHRLRRRLARRIAGIPALRLTLPEELDGVAPHMVHFLFPGMPAEAALHALEQRGICISSRSACSSGKPEPSRVLLAMGLTRELAESGLRVSFGEAHTEADIDAAGDAIEQVAGAMARRKGGES
ncbi:cysteine desulfurase family protein [Paenibacillus cymbidii]|uniref:cysteine desulfurase family protein n=1 Tax=Paenibacillus cymbidii TaxID=1639034 RepID=UPI001081CA94|nr:cysteine desulfurase family protein [Paenibacillus cymbidii]